MVSSFESNIFSGVVPALLTLIATGLISLLIGIWIEKFKNRLILISHSIEYQPLATSSQTDYWGKIEVFHNGLLKNHLSFVTVRMKNVSNRDLESFNISMAVDQQSQILGQSGYYDDSKASVFLEKNYFDYYNDVSARFHAEQEILAKNPSHNTSRDLQNEVFWILKNRTFNVPVFNRGSEITINLLIESIEGEAPVVHIHTLHKSVKLVKAEDEQTQALKMFAYSLLIGTCLYIVGFFCVLIIYSYAKDPLIILFIISLLSSIAGILLLHLGRWIKKLLL